jgi:cysteine desulfurase
MRLPGGRIYLDCNATTPLAPEVEARLAGARGALFGNPSSPYEEGRAARTALSEARARVARLVGCEAGEVIFTGSATEANHLALRSALFASGGRRRVLVSAIEHPSVLEQKEDLEALGAVAQTIPVTRDGVVDLRALEDALGSDVAAVSVMTAHNETGVLQPVEEVGRLCRKAGALFHTDAVQALGKVPSPWGAARPDYLAAAAHKLYGPKGIGALVARSGAPLRPLLRGGGQEEGRRSSTEAVELAAAFGWACELAAEALPHAVRLQALRDAMEHSLALRFGAKIHGRTSPRLPNTCFLSLPGTNGAKLAKALDRLGFAVATGSACHSGENVLPSVLKEMGVDPGAGGTLRISLGRESAGEQVDAFLAALPEALEAARGSSNG